MKILEAVKNTFKNVNELSVMFIYIGLELALGLIIVAIILTLLEGHYGDYVTMICYAKGAQDAAVSCWAVSLFAALICDAAVKDRERKRR